jgi:hypothetical protein
MPFRRQVVEGVPFRLEAAFQDDVRKTLFRLRREMGLSFAPLREDENGFTIWNLIGTIDAGRCVIEVAPKTEPGADWIASVLSLLVGSDPVDAAGERAAGLSTARSDLVEALGTIFAARLGKAIRRDGPISVMSRERQTGSTLRGQLLVSDWVRSAFLNPARFPQTVGTLTTDNDFSKALAFVADMFATNVRRQRTRAVLRELTQMLRPGLPVPTSAPAGVELRELPPQWSVYRPAWSIAAAVLARRSVLGPQGTKAGVSIAIEPWPLLERLLERSLSAATRLAKVEGRLLSVGLQTEHAILKPVGGTAGTVHTVRPDGLLLEGAAPLASFEAKYRAYSPSEGPLRSEIYQAMAAARAVAAPLAVLVYPGKVDPGSWRVTTDGDSPCTVSVIGLDMFNYRRAGDDQLGKQILALVKSDLHREQNEIILAQ